MMKAGVSPHGETDSGHAVVTNVYNTESSTYSMYDDDAMVDCKNRKIKSSCSNCVRYVFLVPAVAAFVTIVLIYGVSRAIQLSNAK